MSDPTARGEDTVKRIATGGGIIVAFVVALEIVIMISPFAAFFYAAFNPFLLSLNQWGATRWLTAFFLPHMIVPPNEALIVVRILGSVLFIGGLLVFLVCAAQVYLGKFLKKGTATGGLYRWIRHPQYLALAATGLGLAIMWPRMLTLVLFGVMLLLYYILARDEERRMTRRYGEAYLSYRHGTGMFLPRAIERLVAKENETPSAAKVAVIFLILLAVILGKGFFLRWYTVESLSVQEIQGVDVLTITEADTATASELVPAVLADSSVAARLSSAKGTPGHRILAYFLPIDYVMQGMIANTGEEYKLFEQHKTIGMITEYVLHPFSHLTEGHAHHMAMAGMKHGPEMYAMPAMKRRVIFLSVSSGENGMASARDDFAINALRTPLLFVDVHLHTAEILQVKDLPGGSGWGTVPTPMF
jgi:protein-S-isoprenylcysteine O-methyltransferase Ste14